MDELTAIAKALDSGKSLDEARESYVPAPPEPEAEPETQADPPPEPEQPKQDESASSAADSSLTEKTEQEKPDISREAKDMERKMRSWKSLNDEKEQFQKEREEFEQQKEKWRVQQMSETNEVRDDEGYSAKDYDKAAAEMLDSLWAKQTPNRAIKLSNQMKKC